MNDIADLLMRLRTVEPDEPGDRTRWHRNPNGPEAAAEIESLRLTYPERDAVERAVVIFGVYHPDLAATLRGLLERTAKQETTPLQTGTPR